MGHTFAVGDLFGIAGECRSAILGVEVQLFRLWAKMLRKVSQYPCGDGPTILSGGPVE